jgi:hypothetical protein
MAPYTTTDNGRIGRSAPTPQHLPIESGLCDTAIIERLAPVALHELGDAELMVRRDTKYIVPAADIVDSLARVASGYRVLDIAGQRLHRYFTRYFDTPALELYHAHQRGVPRRFKVRSRMYVTTGACFLEVKRRTARGMTEKSRQPTPQLATRIGDAERSVLRDNGVPLADLHATLDNEFYRVTLVTGDATERVTIDFGITWSTELTGVSVPAVAVVEVKQGSHGRPSALGRYLERGGSHSRPFSKYCVGMASLNGSLKHNQFQPELRSIGLAAREDSDV